MVSAAPRAASALAYCSFFFFKQKTAYEIVSGDWSSDVCSSDLDVALGYVRANAAALGLGPADIATLRLARRTTVGGVTYLRWRQEAGGVPLLDNDLRMGVDADGRVITLAGAPRAGL